MQFTQKITIRLDPELADDVTIGDRIGLLEVTKNINVSGRVERIVQVGRKVDATISITGRIYQWKA